ncbi:MAG TPA: DNA-directed RNA polymerase subunit alpha C-terminal domain-containing protein [Pirellulaceae bacterium]|nr:DNA-directed RNA polymerase subunit alpha C-terminal domain-containing protein [Pirellulaceae bacterium]
MSQAVIVELKDIVLANSTFGPNEIGVIKRKINEEYAQFTLLRDLAAELEAQPTRSPASSVRLGICQYFLGRYRSAVATLENADGGALAFFYQGKAHLELGNFSRAIACYESAKLAGYDADGCQIAIAEAKRQSGDIEGAWAILENVFGAAGQTAEYLYQRGATLAALGTNPDEVIRLYERAVEIDEKHPGALFGLGLENDRRGNDDRAMEMYQRAASVFPTHVGALMNLGILYEDYHQYQRAARCFDRILESHPANAQARMFRRDTADAMSGTDRWDDEKERTQKRLQTVLQIPISQFQLSVRSRNCLQKMGIMTLGDLTRVSEAELLSSKNFGETSLHEIRDMMTNKGLMVGQFANESGAEPEPIDPGTLTPDAQMLLERPISDLNLSVRARKCMSRLSLTSIGDLIRKTGDDLLECKNFGITSLNEVREKLTALGLKLRGD